jgi:hypothetical protein
MFKFALNNVCMNASQSLRLYELSFEFIKDREKAKEFVSKIEETIDTKFVEKALILATKQDLSETKVDIIKWMVGMWIAQMAAIVFMILKK